MKLATILLKNTSNLTLHFILSKKHQLFKVANEIISKTSATGAIMLIENLNSAGTLKNSFYKIWILFRCQSSSE